MVKALETTYEIVSQVKPLLVMTEKVICFPERNGEAAIVAQVKKVISKVSLSDWAKQYGSN